DVAAIAPLRIAEPLDQLCRLARVERVADDAALDELVLGLLRGDRAVRDRREAARERVGHLLPIRRVHERTTERELADDGRLRVEELREEGDPVVAGDEHLALRP